MVQELVPGTQLRWVAELRTPNRIGMAESRPWQRKPATAMLSGNGANFSLDCQISAAGHARSDVWADGAGSCGEVEPHALRAPTRVAAARDALPSWDV
jgi:hypothetical protein